MIEKNRFFLPVLTFLLSFIVQGQKSYEFDHLLEYNYHRQGMLDTIQVSFLTNSKDNSYFVKIQTNKKNNTYLDLRFIDYNGIYSEFKLRRNDFAQKTNLLDCEHVLHSSNPYKYQVRNYAFFVQKDTLINNVKYSQYLVKCTRSERFRKRNQLGVTHFIVKDETRYHIPFFRHPTLYEEWKTDKNIPWGIPKVEYYVNFDRSLEYKYTLIGFKKIEKTIVVPQECDYVD